MSSEYAKLDEIQGVSFGEADPYGEAVLVNFHVRANATFGGKEGSRANVMLPLELLQALTDGLPGLINAMRDKGADRDVLPPPAVPLPPWNAGPRWNPEVALPHLCTAFDTPDISRELGAVVVVMAVCTPGRHASTDDSDSAEYLMGWRALLGLQEALPKVVRKLEQRAASRMARRH
ncbi:hypothetical protein [Rhodanobacter sp. FW106-PBR-LB-2-11]|uniref:hypothetical protein n=1 Tax=Rhodanobacter sp. FW106-PBR-LB-2-11 TaxID=1524463 RepID=UPI0034E3F0CF